MTVHFADLRIDLSTAGGKLIYNVLASVAQWEAEITSERNKAICARRVQRGLTGNARPPMGFKKVGKGEDAIFVPDRPTRAIMQEIVRLHDEKKLSFAQISERIEATIAEAEGRKPYRPWDKRRVWKRIRCWQAYRKEKQYQAEGR